MLMSPLKRPWSGEGSIALPSSRNFLPSRARYWDRVQRPTRGGRRGKLREGSYDARSKRVPTIPVLNGTNRSSVRRSAVHCDNVTAQVVHTVCLQGSHYLKMKISKRAQTSKVIKRPWEDDFHRMWEHLVSLLVYWLQDYHRNFPRGTLLIPSVERGDF